MIILRTVLILGLVVFFQRIIIEKDSYNVSKTIAFLLVTIISLALLYIEQEALELYYPFFIVMILLGGKTLESINQNRKKDEV